MPLIQLQPLRISCNYPSMNNYFWPSGIPEDGTIITGIESIANSTNMEESIAVDGRIYPNVSQMSTVPLLLQNTTPPVVPFASQKIPTKDEWEEHRQTITRLYRDEKMSLKEVMLYMREQYDFRATPKMYKTRISDWDIRRNLRWSEREAASRVVAQRLLTGDKVSKIVIRGQERDISLLRRHMRRSKLRPLSQVVTAEVKTLNETTGKSLQASRYLNNVNLREPSEECIQRNMYPADDQRDMEIICLDTSYFCEATEVLKSMRGRSHLFNRVKVAEHWVFLKQYKETRLALGKALDVFRVDICKHPLETLLAWLQICISRELWTEDWQFFEEFAQNAYELSSMLCGPNHPVTKVLSHISRLSGGPFAVAAALQAAIASLTARNKPLETFQLVSWLRRRLAEVWIEMEYFSRARAILELEVENCNRFNRGMAHRMRALQNLAEYYLMHEWSCNQFYSVLETAFQLQDEQNWPPFTRSRFSRLLAESAMKLGNVEAAEQLYRESRATALNHYGPGSPEHTIATIWLTQLLAQQGRYEEAEHEENMCRLADDMENLMQIQ